MEGLKSEVDAKQLDVSEQKSGGFIILDNEQQYEELIKMQLPSQQQITIRKKFRLAMQELQPMLRIISIVVQTPGWSSGVWLLIWNKYEDCLYALRPNK